jgi:K(+)-stimulated pyrophosphate-energized sodium pump
MQAVTTGAYRAVAYIKKHMKLDGATKASVEDSKRVVAICTKYAQRGMAVIFLALFFLTLGCAFAEPYFFIGYLVSIAIAGLYQAIFMANAGGAWDNAKKVVEVNLKQKGTELHAATVVGDTVGDPFKDTSSVALNPVIKFTSLFGLLAVEVAGEFQRDWPQLVTTLSVVFLVFGCMSESNACVTGWGQLVCLSRLAGDSGTQFKPFDKNPTRVEIPMGGDTRRAVITENRTKENRVVRVTTLF